MLEPLASLPVLEVVSVSEPLVEPVVASLVELVDASPVEPVVDEVESVVGSAVVLEDDADSESDSSSDSLGVVLDSVSL